jgi:hypothetical protein
MGLRPPPGRAPPRLGLSVIIVIFENVQVTELAGMLAFKESRIKPVQSGINTVSIKPWIIALHLPFSGKPAHERCFSELK